MGALPRPDLPPGPHRDLVVALHDLHHRAGWPSLRTLAGEAGVSHTTISKILSAPAVPAWGTLELLVEALGGSTGEVHALWLAASTPAGASVPSTPLIAGRGPELAAVRAHLDSGTGLLLVTGEAGMGKTTVVDAAARATDTFVATAHCLPLAMEVPLLPIADGLTAVHDVEGGVWLEEALDALPDFVRQSVARLLPQVGTAPPDGHAGAARQHLFTSLGMTLARLAELRPFALVLEDLHWADPSTLDLVEHLLARSTRVPLVGTWRTEDPATPSATRDWLVRAHRSHGTTRLDLEPLSRADSVAQIGLLGISHPERLGHIHDRSQGLPLYTEQLAAHLEDAPGLPPALADLLDRRLDGIDASAWAVLRVLGVAERALTGPQIAAASSVSPAELTTQLHTLRARRLVRSTSDGLVQLQHPLLAEATQRRLLGDEAAQVHRSLADVLGSEPDASAAEVAQHWRSAGDAGRELEWRIAAARSSALAFEWGQEADHWLRALSLWPASLERAGEPPTTRAEAYVAAIDALKESLDWDRAADMSAAAARELGEVHGAERAELLRRAAEYRGEREGVAVGMELIDEAIAIFELLEPSAGHVHALNFKRGQMLEFGEYEQALRLAAATVRAAATVGEPRPHRNALISLAWHEGLAGVPGRTLEVLDEAAALVLDGTDPVGDIRSAVIATDILLLCGNHVAEVEHAARPGLVAARNAGIESEATMILASNLAMALLRAGRVAEADAVVGLTDDRPPDPSRWPLDSMKALVDTRRGALDAAVVRSRVAVDVGPEDEIDLETLCMAAEVDFWRGEAHVTMPRLLRELEVVVDSAPIRIVLPALVTAARGAAEAAGPDPGAGRTITDVRDLVRRAYARLGTVDEVSPQVRAHLATAHAELARATGQDRADPWSEAAALWDELGRPHDAAYCRWRGAQAALHEGRGTVAGRLLKRASAGAREHVPLGRAVTATLAAGR